MHTSPTHTTSILPPHGTTVLTDTMAKKCHTNPTMQEKIFVVDDCSGSRSEMASKNEQVHSFRELIALCEQGSVRMPCVINSVPSQPPIEKLYKDKIVAAMNVEKVDIGVKFEESIPPKLRFKKKHKSSPSIPYRDLLAHLQVFDDFYEDPFLKGGKVEHLKIGDKVLGVHSTYSTPSGGTRAHLVGPFHIHSFCHNEKVILKDAQGNYFRTKKERLQLFKESHEPP